MLLLISVVAESERMSQPRFGLVEVDVTVAGVIRAQSSPTELMRKNLIELSR